MTSNSHNSEFNSSFDNPYNKVTSAPNSPIKGAIVILLAILVSISGMLAAANSYGNADQHHSMGKTHRGPDFEAISAQLQLTEDQTEQLKTLLKSPIQTMVCFSILPKHSSMVKISDKI